MLASDQINPRDAVVEMSKTEKRFLHQVQEVLNLNLFFISRR